MEVPPFENKIQRDYLIRVLTQLNNKDYTLVDKRTSVPDRPVEGKIYYFSNSVGAITSIGYWGYTSAGWVKLG